MTLCTSLETTNLSDHLSQCQKKKKKKKFFGARRIISDKICLITQQEPERRGQGPVKDVLKHPRRLSIF